MNATRLASPVQMPRLLMLVLVLLSQFICVFSQSWTGYVAQATSAQEISSSSMTDVNGLTLTVPATATTDSVFMFINLNVFPSSSLGVVTLTINRDNTDLATSNKVMVNVDHTEAALTQAVTFAYMDIPASIGSFEYKVRGRYNAIVSWNSQVRQIGALVVPSTTATSKTTSFTVVTVSSTNYENLGVDTSVVTSFISDRVLISTTFNLMKSSGGGMMAFISLYRNDVKIDANAMQIVHKFESNPSSRQVTIFYLDHPDTSGSVTYSVRAAKVQTDAVAFTVCDGGNYMAHMNLMVVSDINSNSATALTSALIVSTDWTEVGLSTSITPASIKDQVLITVNINFNPSVAAASGAFTIFRGSTNLGDATYGLQVVNSPTIGGATGVPMSFLDSPNTDTSVTYTVKVRGLNTESFMISTNDQTRQIAVVASRAAACNGGGCAIQAGKFLQRVSLPASFKLVFGITLPNVSPFSGTQNIITLKHYQNNNPILSVERVDLTTVKIIYNGADIAVGWPLISASIGGTTPTIYTITVIGGTISINNNNNGHTTPLPYNIASITVDTSAQLYNMYISHSDQTSSVGTISSIRIIDMTSTDPTAAPTAAPTTKAPTLAPTINPSANPTVGPTVNPSAKPTVSPTVSPTSKPTFAPTTWSPTVAPTLDPTAAPTLSPTRNPTLNPSANPSVGPSVGPSVMPTLVPTVGPTPSPTLSPTLNPTRNPSANPSVGPSVSPSAMPTLVPTVGPTPSPTLSPTVNPTRNPSANPSVGPSVSPSTVPTLVPTTGPTPSPTLSPTVNPTRNPSANPSVGPSVGPSVTPTVIPTAKPTVLPTCLPTLNPTINPTVNPSINPSASPSRVPSLKSTAVPTCLPTEEPSDKPTASPSVVPSASPSVSPSLKPSAVPTVSPSVSPTFSPSVTPSLAPSVGPSVGPTLSPTITPSMHPSRQPTVNPSAGPSQKPSTAPSQSPSASPSVVPTVTPSVSPTLTPTVGPSAAPSCAPSASPSVSPSAAPSCMPTQSPSLVPSVSPTVNPSATPTVVPTVNPSKTPSACPTIVPSASPSAAPSVNPTVCPSVSPSAVPSAGPTVSPSVTPSVSPTVSPSKAPSTGPTVVPSVGPSTAPSAGPTVNPSVVPSVVPTVNPSKAPTVTPSASPSAGPSAGPSISPSNTPTTNPSVMPSSGPSAVPSAGPTAGPSTAPSVSPTLNPSVAPSAGPTVSPTVGPSAGPSVSPSSAPTEQPSVSPSVIPTAGPSAGPSAAPSAQPSAAPTASPSTAPSTSPSANPTVAPTEQPSADPSASPSADPSADPSVDPTINPSANPTEWPSAVPSISPSIALTVIPTADPTVVPSVDPSVAPSTAPNEVPSQDPNTVPTVLPSVAPTVTPSVDPSAVPSVNPSTVPTMQPSVRPTVAPSTTPTVSPSTHPSAAPSVSPTHAPTAMPSTTNPTTAPTVQATDAAGIIVPAVPQLASAAFNNAGSTVVVTFSSSTDKAGYSSGFFCSAILSFTGTSTASCVWTDAATITVYPSAATLNVGSPVALVSDNKVKAACPASVSATVCASWSQATAASVSIQAPISPTAPVVVLSVPSTVTGCSPLSLDISASSGSGGRAWLAPVFTVTSEQGDVSAVAAFLNSGFSFNSPTSVPNALFPVDGVYTISVTLSNFLGAKSVSSRDVTVIKSSDAYPTVSIPGADVRTVLTNAPLLLTPSAYTIDCSGVRSTSDLSYSWTVFINGMVQTSLTSESLDTSRFRLSAYRLTPLKTYDILVTVTNTRSGKFSTASVSVAVQKGAVVAQVSGSGSQTVLVDGSLTLDASSSLDQDIATLTGTAAGLSFVWSCMQTAPEQSNSCPLTVSGDTSLPTLTLTAPSTAAGSKSSITVTVTKGTRTSSATVSVTAQDSSAPLVAITTSTQSVTSVNANNRLSLSASVTAQSSCTAVWSVADSSVKLSTSALSPVSSVVPVGSTRVVNLVLAASALPERSSLAFTLACGESSAAITVTTNGPPLPGLFSVTPATGGIELSTSFAFSATFWSDTELPITYQFGFVSPSSGATLTVQGRSESSFAATTLAAGSSSAQYAVTVLAKVFDALNAASSASSAVAVNPQTDVALLRASLAAQLTSSAGSTEGTKNAISVGSTVINAVSCSSSPICANLNRAACAKVQNTCGSCLTGYVGDSGDGNSLCVSATSSGGSEKTIGSTCSASDVCGGWLACDMTLTAPVCYLPYKACADDCSGHGTCVALNANSRKQVTSCSAGDATCVVSCVCDESFGGPNCGTSSAELLEKQALRSQFLQSLSDVAASVDADTASVTALTNSLSSLAQNPYELSAESVTLVNQVANSVLTSAATLGDFSYESAVGVLSAIDAAAAATVRMNSSNTASFANGMMLTIALFNSLVQSQLVAGQDGVQYIQDSFRLSSIRQLRGFNTSLKILSPTSLLEQSNGGKASTVTIDADISASSGSRLLSVEVDGEEEEFAVDMVVTAASSYGSAGDSFNSNPVQVTVSRTASTPTRVTFVLVHNGAGNFTSREEAASMNFNSTCTGVEDRSQHFYECPGSNEVLSHNCTGLSGVLTSYCPVRAPTCAILEGNTGVANTSSTDCDVLSFDLYSTTCSCLVQPSAEAAVRSRRLSMSDLEQTGLLDAVSVIVYMGNEFKNTFNSADDLNSAADLQRVLIVIIMFSTLWAGGLLLLFGLAWRRNIMKKVNEKKDSRLEKKVQVAEMSRSPAAVHQYLTDYVILTFPSVFSNKPFFSRLYGEIKRHHRYLTLFTAPEGENGDKQRILTGVQLLTIQTMLMFLLAMLYDVQSPSDDGSCGTKYDVESCLHRKSVFDSTVSYCDWTLTDEQDQIYTCLYRNPTFSFKVILYISVIVALLTALISYPTDLIFDTLSAPVADVTKAAAQESVINKIGRRASNVARRASNAAMSAAAAAKAKITRNKYVVGTVTRKLPGATEAAHALATASMTVIAENSRRTMQQRQLSRMRSYQESSGKHGDVLLSVDDLSSSSSESDSSDSDSDGGSEDNTRRGEIVTSQKATTAGAAQSAQQVAEAQLAKLSEEVHCQRRLLKASEVEEFDSQWGLDPTGEFTQGERSVVPCLRGRPGARESILSELQFVRKESNMKAGKLAIATDAHTGLEILHLFIIDLLGRDTPAAVIFETKSEEDFQHARVVTRNTKRLAAVALFCINAFFVYYSILTGFRKGVAWQQIFLLACIIQFIVEVLLFETMEVVWINCAIPVLVSDEVRRVGESIIEVVQELCGNASIESRFFLNAPDYLFVSTNVAKQFPHLMESILVQAYNNHVPGELARKWQTGSIARMHRRNRRRQFTVFGLFLRTLQYIGTAPFVIHRMFIRFLQPFVFSGLLLLWQLIVSNVIYIAIAVFCVLVFLAYGLYRRYHEQVLMEKSQNVTPVAAAAATTDYRSSKSDAVYDDDRVIDIHIPNLTALTTNRNHSSVGSSWEEKDMDTEDDGSETVPRRHARKQRNRREDSHRQTSSDELEERSSTESSRGHTRGRKSHSPTPRDFAISNSDLSSLDLSTSIHAAPVPHTIGGSPRTVSRTAGYGSKVSPRQRVTVARGVYSSSSSEDEHEDSVSDDSLGSSEGEESRL